jgi:hypothetical protein
MSYVPTLHPAAFGAINPIIAETGMSPPLIAENSVNLESAPTPKPGLSSIIGQIGGALLGALTNKPVAPTPPVVPVATGMSTTTKVALAGGALLAVVLIARRR